MTAVLAVPETLSLADLLADRLRDTDAVWPAGPPPDGRFWPQSLAAGAAGIALLHAERARSGRGDWDTARAWLSVATSGDVSAAGNASLFFGAPTLAFVLHIAASASHRYQRALAALDSATIAVTRDRLDQARARIDRAEQPEIREFDLVRGLAGLAAYHVACHPDHQITQDVLAYLARLTEPLQGNGTLPPWWTSVAPNGEPSTDYPQGHGNFGMSHGISAVLAVLSIAQTRGLTPATAITDAIARICAWTDRWRQGGPDTPWWPGLITIGQARASRIEPLLRPVPSWCYGVSGTARAQQLAGLALGDPDRQQIAEAAMLAVLRDPEQLGRLAEPGLCHGSSGLLYCAWRMSADALTPGIGEEVPKLAARITSKLAGGGRLADLGLLDGAAGVALALHTVGAGSAPAPYWDSFLALA